MDPAKIHLAGDAEEEYIPEDEPEVVPFRVASFIRKPASGRPAQKRTYAGVVQEIDPDYTPRSVQRRTPQSLKRQFAGMVQNSDPDYTPRRVQGRTSEKKNKRTYNRKMSAKRECDVPYWMLLWLGLWNAKTPGPIRRVYNFVEENFPGCITPDSKSWQSSLRERVTKEKDLFEEVDKYSVGALDTSKDRQSSKYWTFRDGSHSLFMHKLNQWMRNKKKTPFTMGLANPDEWDDILAGRKGLPEDGVPLWRMKVKEGYDCEVSYEPVAKRARIKPVNEIDSAGKSRKDELIEDHDRDSCQNLKYQMNGYSPTGSPAPHRSSIPHGSPAQYQPAQFANNSGTNPFLQQWTPQQNPYYGASVYDNSYQFEMTNWQQVAVNEQAGTCFERL